MALGVLSQAREGRRLGRVGNLGWTARHFACLTHDSICSALALSALFRRSSTLPCREPSEAMPSRLILNWCGAHEICWLKHQDVPLL